MNRIDDEDVTLMFESRGHEYFLHPSETIDIKKVEEISNYFYIHSYYSIE